MSATLDASLFSGYYGECAVLAAGGRAFPVEHHFLEDVYEATRYVLDPEGICALRPGAAASKAVLRAASQRDKGAVQASFKLQVSSSLEPGCRAGMPCTGG